MKITIRGSVRGAKPPEATKPSEPAIDVTICRHRGDVLQVLTGGTCGTDRRVFSCAVHGRCASRPFSCGELRRQADDLGLAFCRGCPDHSA